MTDAHELAKIAATLYASSRSMGLQEATERAYELVRLAREKLRQETYSGTPLTNDDMLDALDRHTGD